MLHTADEDGRPVAAPIVRGTFVLPPSGAPMIADQQDPIRLAGLPYGDAGATSYRFEPEVAFVKPGVDVVLVGHAHAPRAGATEVDVQFELGRARKRMRVRGDRRWEKALLGARPTPPEPFERIPLVWERAFGGWDRHADDDSSHRCESRNPFGVGYRRRFAPFIEGAPLPNVEDPRAKQTTYTERCEPAGTGFTGFDWEPRRTLAGTYGAKWEKTRKPRLPEDFDRRFFQSAAPGMVVERGRVEGEVCRVEGASPEGVLEFVVPDVRPPQVRLGLTRAERRDVEMSLDTLVVDTDARCLYLTWRGYTAVREGPHDIRSVAVTADDLPEERVPLPEPVPFDQPLQLQPVA